MACTACALTPKKLKCCSRCKALYCDLMCQTMHWPVHKFVCKLTAAKNELLEVEKKLETVCVDIKAESADRERLLKITDQKVLAEEAKAPYKSLICLDFSRHELEARQKVLQAKIAKMNIV
jgi:hypothetical protein